MYQRFGKGESDGKETTRFNKRGESGLTCALGFHVLGTLGFLKSAFETGRLGWGGTSCGLFPVW